MPTTIEDSILCDTNIVVRYANAADRQHTLVVGAVLSLQEAGYELVFAPQSMREFWNVATRPDSVNGLGLSITRADELASKIETSFTLLHDTPEMHTAWRRLVVEHEVKGVQVHDARLAASALAGGCRAILTLNDPDFKRFGVPALHPREVEAFLTNDPTSQA